MSTARTAGANRTTSKLPLTTRAPRDVVVHVRSADVSTTRNRRSIEAPAVPSTIMSTAPQAEAVISLNMSAHQDPQLISTLNGCLDEVRKLDFQNAELERTLRKTQRQVAELSIELEQTKTLLAEKTHVEDANLRLQARLLSLDRSELGTNSEFSSEQFEQQRLAYDELQKQYALLDGYYQELLLYVRESQRKQDDDE